MRMEGVLYEGCSLWLPQLCLQSQTNKTTPCSLFLLLKNWWDFFLPIPCRVLELWFQSVSPNISFYSQRGYLF